MTREAATQIAEMIDAHWNMFMFQEGQHAAGAEFWVRYLIQHDDVELAMAGVAALAERQPQRPTIADLRGMIQKIETDRRMARPAIEEPEFVREIEPWVKGWLVARIQHGDTRVWPQQKEGYDALQLYNPSSRDYVWPEQIVMPPEKQTEYEQAGANLSAQQITTMIGKLTGA